MNFVRKRVKMPRLYILYLFLCIPTTLSQLVRGGPPIFDEINEKSWPTYSQIAEGQSFHLSCPISDHDVSISWTLNGEILTTTSKILQIPSVTPEDAGIYRCIAKNAMGAVLSQHSTLDVQYLHDFSHSDGDDRSVSISKGQVFVLRRPDLVASNDLQVQYTWYRNDAEVSTNSSFYVTARGDLVVIGGSLPGQYRVTAFVDGLNEAASGLYNVEEDVSNSEDNTPFTIVYGPSNRTISLRESTVILPVEFDCVPSINDGVRIRWFKNGVELTENIPGIKILLQHRRLQITNPQSLLQKKAFATLECRADGASGRIFANQTAELKIKTLPHINILPSELSKAVGEPLSIRCSSKEGQDNSRIQWWKNGQQISSPDGILQIRSLSHNDFGVLQCEAFNEVGNALSTIWLHESAEKQADEHKVSSDGLWGFEDTSMEELRKAELKAPHLKEIPKNTTGRAGQSATLTCTAEGIPLPTISWKFNGNSIHGETSKYDISSDSLTINELKSSDSGNYVCVAVNEYGTMGATAILTVTGFSFIENGPTNQSILIGTNIEIPCEVTSDLEGKVDITWSLNDEPIGPSGNGALRLQRNQKGGLLIRQVGPDNIGEYRCTVRANGVEQSQAAWLRIIERPSMPVAVKAELVNDTVPAKIRVAWREGFDGNSPIIRHSIEMRSLGPTGQWGVWETVVDSIPPENCCSWLIDNIKPSVTAEFRVMAANRFGSGMPSQSSQNVTMPQQPPAAAPKGVAASARSSSSIMVQWQPPVAEQWNGDILGYLIRYRLAGYTLPWNEKNVTNTHVRNIPIEPLITWREYEIQVAAYNHRGLGVFSKSLYVTTLEGVPTQAPKKVKVDVLNSTAVQVSFKAPDQQRIPGVNLGYKVQFWKGQPGRGSLYKQMIVDPFSAELNLVVDGLEKWGHYNVTVLCYTAPGEGPKSESKQIVTEEDIPGSVADLGIDQVMSNSAVVQWAEPHDANGKIVGYEVRFWPLTDSSNKQIISLAGNDKNTTLEGLSASTQYGVDIRAATSKGPGPRQETHFESGVPPVLPGRASTLSLSDVQSRSVQLQFVPGFDGHTVIRQWVVEGKMGDSNIFHTVFNTSAPKAKSLLVTGLRPFTKYQLRLVAENVVGRGAPSEPTRMFETKQTNPDAPQSRLWVEPVSSTSLVLSWTPLQQGQWNGQPKGYLIVYRENGTDEWKEVRTASLRATEFTLRDLKPFTDYEVDLFAENVIGRSVSSGLELARTYESVPAGAPQSVKAESDGKRTISVQWSAVDEELINGEILGYKVRLVPEKPELRSEFERSLEIVGEKMMKARISNLRPFTSYQIFVSARTVVGSGPENTSPTIAHTGEDLPSEPSHVGFSLVNEEEIRLKWFPPDMPNGKIKAYTVTYWRLDEEKSTAITVPIGSTTYAFSASGLDPNTKYRFTVTAENDVGTGPEAQVDVVTTSVRLPVRNPQIPTRDDRKAFGSSDVSIIWAPLVETEEDAPIRYVQIEYQKANDAEWTAYPQSVPASHNKVTITRLRPNTSYRMRIRMCGDFSQSSWSSESEWIKTLSAKPDLPPTKISVSPYENNAMMLQLDAPERDSWNSDVIGYKISYRAYPSNDTWQTQEITPEHEAEQKMQTVVRNLQSFRHYIVQVRSFNTEGASEPAQPVFVYVGYSIPRGNVTGLTVEPRSSTSVSLRWDAWTDKDDVISGFKVRYVPLLSVLSPESQEEQLMIVENNTAILNDLMKCTNYQISVSPYNRAGEGGAGIKRVQTLEDVPGPVGNLVFEDVLLDSVNVSWSSPAQPNGRIIGYIVNYKTYKLQGQFKKDIQTSTQMPFLLAANLEEGVTCYFTVRAETSAGSGPETSGNITIGPSELGPPAPSNPTVIPGQTSFTLEWKDGSVTGKGIVGHLIQAKRVSKAKMDPSLDHLSEDRRRRSFENRPTHIMGEWITLSNVQGRNTHYEVGYRELEPSSFYVFRVYARNGRGVGFPSGETDQLFVPASLPDDPFYTKWWFIALVAMATFVVIVCVIAFLCVTGSAAKYEREKRRRSVDSLQLADGNLATFQLKQGVDHRISRSRNDMFPRPDTHTSWISDREPAPAYGSVLGGRDRGPDMYGLATDIMPSNNDVAAAQRLSVLAGRDVRGSAYALGNASRAQSERVSPRGGDETDGFDSFDEESLPGDREPRGDIAGHYAHSDHYSATWRRMRDSEPLASHQNIRVGVPPPPLHRPPRPESTGTNATGSDRSWPSQPAPALEKGFSSFV